MAALEDIRSALAEALSAVSGLSTYETVPGQLSVPAAVVAPDNVEYDTDFDGGATYRLPIQFLVNLGDWATAQRQLDRFVGHDSEAVAAIHGATVETRVTGMESYGLTDFSGTSYLGAQLLVEVIV